jgi:hypothetical protein
MEIDPARIEVLSSLLKDTTALLCGIGELQEVLINYN